MLKQFAEKIKHKSRLVLNDLAFSSKKIPLYFCKIRNINLFDRKVYSQNGEDGILEAIFFKIGVTNKFFVEFGVENGSQCNTRFLREKMGWHGLLMDANESRSFGVVNKEFITAENINQLFKKYEVPNQFDLLSIDIDGNDYWVWAAIESRYEPRVVVIEYNASIPASESKVIPYDASFRWDGTNYFGASLLALANSGNKKGYTLVGCDANGVNAFFVKTSAMKHAFNIPGLRQIYKPAGYNNGLGHPVSTRTMTSV